VNKKDHFSFNVTDIELDVFFKFNGWHSLGLVQRKEGIVQCYFNSQELIKEYHNTDFHCDHCHKHVHRNSVVVLEHDNGERKVVGTSCVKEFTQGLDGNLIACYMDLEAVMAQRNSEMKILLQGESLDEMPISVFSEQHGTPIYKVDRIVSCAVRLINAYGFEPSDSLTATWKYIYEENKRCKDIEAEAVKAIEWIKSLTEDEFTKSSYLFNLRSIIDADYCTMRHFGLLTSLIPTYRKHNAEAFKKDNPSNYVGNKGDKLNLTLTYTKSFSYESAYGTGFFHIFTDSDGNVFKWSTNKSLTYKVDDRSYNLDQGATLKLSGTVKDHEEYRGIKQTSLTRCKYEVLTSVEREERVKEMEEWKKNHPKKSGLEEWEKELLADWG
jgi:hypothetical protein